MAVFLPDNLSYVGNRPNVERDVVASLSQLLAEEPAKQRYPYGHIVFCEEDGKHYKFNYNYADPSSNGEKSETTGWFVVLTQGGATVETQYDESTKTLKIF